MSIKDEVSDLAELPSTVIIKDRQVLSTAGDVWRLRANADGGGWLDIDFRPMREHGTTRFVAIAKRYIANKARTSAMGTLVNIALGLNRAVRFWHAQGNVVPVAWFDITEARFQALLSHGVSATPLRGTDANIARALYVWGAHIVQLPDFDPQIAFALKGIRIPGALKGQKVMSGDPEEGPFVSEEVLLVDQAIKDGKGEPHDLVIVQLLVELGLRPIQMLRARAFGLKRYEANSLESGIPQLLIRYTLEIPRAKGRGEYRVEETRPISTLLASRLQALMPPGGDKDTRLFWWMDEYAVADNIARVIVRWVKAVGLISPLTHEKLRTTPTRFRYTLATEAARDGASRTQIAHLLFHTDLQNVEVYIDAAGSVMDQIEDKLNNAFGSDIDHFLGKVVSAHDAEPFDGLVKRVVPGVFPQLPEAPVLPLGLGACGQNIQHHGLCKLAPPITCYLCPKFAAFREADHKSVGDALDKMARTQFEGRADSRIGGELVRVVQAIRELEVQIAAEQKATS